MIDQILKL